MLIYIDSARDKCVLDGGNFGLWPPPVGYPPIPVRTCASSRFEEDHDSALWPSLVLLASYHSFVDYSFCEQAEDSQLNPSRPGQLE